MLWASKLSRQQWRLFRARILLGWLRVGLSFERFDSVLIWINLTFQWPALTSISLSLTLNFALTLLFYVRRYVFSLRYRICNWLNDIFLKTNGLEHCFLAPAKLPRSAILNNFVDKLVKAIQKSLKLLLYLRNPPEIRTTQSKFVYNPWNTCYTGCPIKKATQAFGSCSRTRVPISFKLTMDIVWKMAKIIVTKANSLGVLPHLECDLLRRLHFCYFHWTRRSLPKKFSWNHPKTRLDFEKCPEQKDKSLRTPFASNCDRNRLWDVRQGCQPPPFGGTCACPRWSAGRGPTSSAFFKSLLRVTHKMFILITYITCFAIYLGTQQCINFYFRGNISSFMTENNSSRFFWTPGTIVQTDVKVTVFC